MNPKVLDTRHKQLKPVAVVAPFVNAEAAHWLDEFDGDPTIDQELVTYAQETIFTTDPAPFHAALDAAEKAFSQGTTVHQLFGLDLPEALGTTSKLLEQKKNV